MFQIIWGIRTDIMEVDMILLYIFWPINLAAINNLSEYKQLHFKRTAKSNNLKGDTFTRKCTQCPSGPSL